MLVALVEIVGSARHAELSGLSFAPTLTATAPAFTHLRRRPGRVALHRHDGVAERPRHRRPRGLRLRRHRCARALVDTGAGTLLGAVLGGHVVNLAAISAALCAGEDAHPDPGRRFVASSTAGITYIAFGLGAGLLSALVAVAPAGLVESVAGLALLGTLGGSLAVAVAEDVAGATRYRDAAVVTFLVTASGTSFGGIGSRVLGPARGPRARGVPERARARLCEADTARMSIPIILDCDPGHDDAIALLLALASPELELLGVTTVHGNQTLEKTTANAIRVLDLAGPPTSRSPPARDRPRRPRAARSRRTCTARAASTGRRSHRRAVGRCAAGRGRPRWHRTIAESRRPSRSCATGPADEHRPAARAHGRRERRAHRADGRSDRRGQHDAGGRVQHLGRPGGRAGGLPRGRRRRR